MSLSSQISSDADTGAREPKRQRGRDRVATLLDAAAALFAQKGYDAATMTEIAQQAGASIGSLYQFFPSKSALAEALLSRYAVRVDSALDTLIQAAPGRSPGMVADTLVDLMLDLRQERAAVIPLLDARNDVALRRAAFRDSIRRKVAQMLVAAHPPLPLAQAGAMAVVLLFLMKAVPELAQEEEAGARGHLVAEARCAMQLYISQGMDRA